MYISDGQRTFGTVSIASGNNRKQGGRGHYFQPIETSCAKPVAFALLIFRTADTQTLENSQPSYAQARQVWVFPEIRHE